MDNADKPLEWISGAKISWFWYANERSLHLTFCIPFRLSPGTTRVVLLAVRSMKRPGRVLHPEPSTEA
jgi:hypothetical protein